MYIIYTYYGVYKHADANLLFTKMLVSATLHFIAAIKQELLILIGKDEVETKLYFKFEVAMVNSPSFRIFQISEGWFFTQITMSHFPKASSRRQHVDTFGASKTSSGGNAETEETEETRW